MTAIGIRLALVEPRISAAVFFGGVAHPEVRGHRADLADRPVGHQLANRATAGQNRVHIASMAKRPGRRDDLPGRRRGDRE